MFVFTEDSSLKEANAALVEENRRLRAEVQEARVCSVFSTFIPLDFVKGNICLSITLQHSQLNQKIT